MQITKSLRDLELEDSYDSGDSASDIVSDFFEPALSSSEKYSRLAGYFNSGMLAACARGMSNFVLGNGLMRLVCSPHLSEFDIRSLETETSESGRYSVFENAISRGIKGLGELEDLLERQHIQAMCWLLEKNRLEVRIAVPKTAFSESDLFHQKRGVLEDSEGNKISFSGSINETHAGWTTNIEEFKVFRSWVPGQAAYLERDEEAFLQYWDSAPSLKHVTIPLNTAIREMLIRSAPKDISHIDLGSTRRKAQIKENLGLRPLRSYQEAAVAAWNIAGRTGILQMATGAGKTLVASHCIQQIVSNEGGVVVVTAPYQHIAMQWESELSHLGPICLWKSGDWRKKLSSALRLLRTGIRKFQVVISVQNTAASDDFLEILGKLPTEISRTLIADEAHGLGAKRMSKALAAFYDNRLGLTATPTRYFDEVGSELLLNYFGGCVYEFTLDDALNTFDESGRTILCPYEYHPVFFRLREDEIEAYRELSLKILRLGSPKEGALAEQRNHLLVKRARIVKSSTQKIPKLAGILDSLEDLTRLVVYCENLDQMALVASELGKRGVVYSRFSGAESTRPDLARGGLSERESILRDFTTGAIDALVAMKCLDEGVNIPTAETAIFLASSGNEKEFIQRRGRMMRQSPITGKRKARIFDLVALPDFGSKNDIEPEEIKIIEIELRRILEFASSALNQSQVDLKIRVTLDELGLAGEIELGK